MLFIHYSWREILVTVNTLINGNEPKSFLLATLLSSQVMTLIVTLTSSLILFIYFSTLKWVDINIIESGRITGDKVVTSGSSAVCRFVICITWHLLQILKWYFDISVSGSLWCFCVQIKKDSWKFKRNYKFLVNFYLQKSDQQQKIF